MANNTYNSRPSQGAFHKIGLSFGSAGAIVRMTADDRIHSCVASWVRTRKGKTDKVFLTLPQQLLGPAEELVKCVTLSGDEQKRRFDFFVAPEVRICNMLEGTSDGGAYAVVYMDRVGQIADFQSMMYRLDTASWRADTGTAQPIRTLGNWLHEDFLEHAAHVPSAWPIMYAASSLFGGQDQLDIDKLFEGKSVSPPQLPADLAMALDDERRFRSSSRRARALSPAQVEAFRKTLVTPEQQASFEALLRGERTYA